MKIASGLLFLVFGNSHGPVLVNSERGAAFRLNRNRGLFSQMAPKQTAGNIPVRRYKEWEYSGQETADSYVASTNRAGHKKGKNRPPKSGNQYYASEEGYYGSDYQQEEIYYSGNEYHEDPYYEQNYDWTEEEYYKAHGIKPPSGKGKRPSEQEFQYIEKRSKKSKGDGLGKYFKKSSKSSKSEDCKNYYYEYQYEYDIYPEYGPGTMYPEDEGYEYEYEPEYGPEYSSSYSGDTEYEMYPHEEAYEYGSEDGYTRKLDGHNVLPEEQDASYDYEYDEEIAESGQGDMGHYEEGYYEGSYDYDYGTDDYNHEYGYGTDDYYKYEYGTDDYNYDQYGHGKGSGKGHNIQKGYGKGYGMPKGTKHSKKYPKKSSKKSKKAKKTKICVDPTYEPYPTFSPAPTESNDVPSMRPPLYPTEAPRPSEPMPPSPFTQSPTDESSVAVELPAYALAYDVPDSRQPTREELDMLLAITSLYLESFMFDEFDGNTFTVLDDFITDLLTSNYATGQPITVDYLSTALINPFSSMIPSDEAFNSALIDAFSGLNMLDYEVLLNDNLPEDNVFVGSTVIFLQEEPPATESSPPSDTSGRGISGTGIAAAAVACTLLVAGVVIYKRRRDLLEELEVDKLNKAGGDVTVAGETFTGETYDGSASVSAASMEYSRKYQDEEDGARVFGLGTIPEAGDSDSVTPAYGRQFEEAEDNDGASLNQVGGSSVGSNSAFRSGVRIGSFEEVALQGPTPGRSDVAAMPSLSEDETSQMSNNSHRSRSANYRADHSNALEIKSLPSYDSSEGRMPPISNALSIRDNSSRRPRTVAEIEALLSADLDNGSSSHGTVPPAEEELPIMPASRPRTIEEIESLLQDDLGDDSTLELPFSDEDETINEDDQ
mmetsp:Transcript_10055/g.17825  ORF Transcript_10055/g.17825 Transcript_10055/m.17825 type:complete len:884 (-) Transcript_10055:77-2728(-)